jgi:hypothetical protein
MSFKEVHEKGLGQSEKGDYSQTMATILLVRSENAIYKACPTAECNKKVIDLENGMYRCEQCNREYPNFKYRLLVSVRPSEVGIRIGNPVNLSEDRLSRYNIKVESPSSTTTEDSSDVGQPARKRMRVEAPNILNQSSSGSQIISQISTLAP